MKKYLYIILSLTLISCSTVPDNREPASFQTCLELMTSIMNYKPYSGSAAKSFNKASDLSELESFYGGDSLIEIQKRVDNDKIKSNNENIKKLLLAPFKVKPIKGKSQVVTILDANKIYKAMEDSNVNKNHNCYDTKGTIGFCFGRATIAHMEAIAREVHPDNVKKIWIAGDMGVWGHHVATMLYTEKGWMVLDTNLGRIVSSDEWIKSYMGYKKGDKDIMVFATQAGRFGPYDNRPYNAVDLFNTQSEDFDKAKDYFKGYFHDYFESLDNVKSLPLHKS